MKFKEEIEILIDLLSLSSGKGISLDALTNRLKDNLSSSSTTPLETDASEIIQYALDNWIVDKVIDDPEPIGPQVWFIKTLDEEGSKFYRELSDVEKATIKILRASENDGEVGKMREDVLLNHLNELGFDVKHVPSISERVSICFTREDGKMVRWRYITSQFELSEEFKKTKEEAERVHEEKLSRRYG